MDISGAGFTGSIRVEIQPNFQPDVQLALKWRQLDSGYWVAADRGAESDIYRCKVECHGYEQTINDLIQAIYDNRTAETGVSNVLTLSNFTDTEKIFGEDVVYINDVSATVLEVGPRHQYSLNAFSVALDIQAISPSFTGVAGDVTLNNIDEIYKGYSERTISKIDSYDGTFSYHDKRADSGIFEGTAYLTNSDMISFSRTRATQRGDVITTTMSGVDNVFGPTRNGTWSKDLKFLEVKDQGYWGLHHHKISYKAVEDIPVAIPFKFKVITNNSGSSNNDQFILPLNSAYSYNFNINWGDGSAVQTVTSNSDITHTFSGGAGTYEISIIENEVGGFPTIYFNSSNDRLKIVDITQWGTNKWLTFNNSFYGCSNLVITATDEEDANTGNVTSFYGAWYNCSSLTSFPLIDTSSGTNFIGAWRGCSSLTSFSLIDTSSGTDFQLAWAYCDSLTSFPLIDTSSGIDFEYAWYNCYSLTSFPLIDTSSGTSFHGAWEDCSSLTSFPLIDTSSGTNFIGAWRGCSSLTSFSLIDTSSGINFSYAWDSCSSLTSFPLIDTSSGTDFKYAWSGCTSLTSFPLIDTSSGTNFMGAWWGCSSLTSFPLIDMSSGTNFEFTWTVCTSLTSFPLIDMSSGTTFYQAWYSCSSLTSFPPIDMSSGTNFEYTWYNCSSLTSFPLINTSSGTNFSRAWYNCTSLTSFALIDTSSGTNFSYAWENCSSLTSFPLIDTSSGTSFYLAWYYCTSLTSFPLLNLRNATNLEAWSGCTLDTDSYSDILVDLATYNTNTSVYMYAGFSNYYAAVQGSRDTLTITRGWYISDGGPV
jgi:hypothetical protein